MTKTAAPARSQRPITATKTAKPGRGGNVLPVGAHPGNTGGKKGASGRKPDEFKALCAELVSNTATLAAAREILGNAGHPAWPSVFKAIAPYGFGQPKQEIEMSGGQRNTLTIELRHAPTVTAPKTLDIGSQSWSVVG